MSQNNETPVLNQAEEACRANTAPTTTSAAAPTSGRSSSSSSQPCQIIHQLSISPWRYNGTWWGTLFTMGRGTNDYYITAVRGLIRCPNMVVIDRITKEKKHNDLIGLVIEAFGYRDLRAAHFTKVFRHQPTAEVAAATTTAEEEEKTKNTPNEENTTNNNLILNNSIGTLLTPVTYKYKASTATYKLCTLFYRADDFLPHHSYTFEYNGAMEYAHVVFLDHNKFDSMDDLFATDNNNNNAAQDSSSSSSSSSSTVMLNEMRFPPSQPLLEWDLQPPPSERIKADQAAGQWGNPNGPRAPFCSIKEQTW